MKRILIIGAIVIIVAGIALAGYPMISDYLMRRNSTRAIENYTLSVAMMNQQDIKQEWAEAQRYNQLLADDMKERTHFSKRNLEGNDLYEGILDLNEEIGHIEIPKIGVHLPIYHGTEEKVLKKGVGHMANTAFPIGSMDSHSVLTGHSGLLEATLFTRLEELEMEDTFYINILDTKMEYRIDLIEVVTPEDTSLLQMERGKSYTTLVTCTPYGINTHRLLVRGEYIISEQQPTGEAMIRGDETVLRRIIIVLGILLVLLGIVLSSYPLVSQKYFQYKADNIIARYNAWVEEQDIKDETADNSQLEKLYQIMRKYNARIYAQKQAELVDPFAYQQTDINLTSFGLPDEVVGYIEIPNIKVRLPIYLGANDDNMSKGAVHLTQTSYPIGGINTNTVIAAHRGYAKAKMFRNIEQIMVGDRITVTNFRETLNYQVIDTMIIAPSEIDRVLIQEGKDMVTLITCHPYRHNYQRYVVYAVRVI